MKLKITVDDKIYEVDVEVTEDEHAPSGSFNGPSHNYVQQTPTALPSAPPPARPGAAESDLPEDKVCRSPVAGIVVRVNAQPGQQIQANDPLLVLEAMKMETNITSPVAGKIKAINAGVGDGVQMNQVLVEFE